MNKNKILILSILFNYCLVLGQTYNELFMRDIAICLDVSENEYKLLDIQLAQNSNYKVSTAVTDIISEILYHEACPLIITPSSLCFLLKIAEITTVLLDDSEETFNDISLMTLEYENTILYDFNELYKLKKIMKHIYQRYQYLKQKTLKNINHLSLEQINKELLNDSQKFFTESYPEVSNAYLTTIYSMFKYFLVVQKLKNSSISIFEINNMITLIVPESYIYTIKEQWNFSMPTINFSHDDSEFILGLNFKQFKKTSHPFKSSSYTRNRIIKTQQLENYLTSHLIALLQDIFITPKALISYYNSHVPIAQKEHYYFVPYLWNMVFFGHGGPTPNNSNSLEEANASKDYSVSGIPKKVFIKMLKYINLRKNTNLIFVVSCRSGSKELLSEFNLPNLSYILAIGNVNESNASRSINYSFTISNNNKFKIAYPTNIATFFKILKEDKRNSYLDLFNYLNTFWHLNNSQSKLFKPHNIPQIKFPNTDWFQVIELEGVSKKNADKVSFTLNKLLLKLHEHSKQPILITNKDLLFISQLYPYEQPASLTNTLYNTQLHKVAIRPTIKTIGPKLPTVITLGSSNTHYIFNLLDASSFQFSSVLLKFIGIPDQFDKRTFTFHKLLVKNSLNKNQLPLNSDVKLFTFLTSKNSSSPLHSSSKPILELHNVVLKINLKKNVLKLKFDYKGMQYIIKAPNYAEFAKFLENPQGYPAIKIKTMLLDGSTTSATILENDSDDRSLMIIEKNIEQKLRHYKEQAMPEKVSLKILSQTLTSLSAEYNKQIKL